MKVLLLKDVYNLGRAGEVKKVAAGYGRNFLLPQGLAVLATKGAMKQAEYIRKKGEQERVRLNQELSDVAEQVDGLELTFGMKAGETGKLYGSVTPAMIADAINEIAGTEIDSTDVDSQPLKLLGVHEARVRLTIDLIPEISIVVHREGEPPESVKEEEPVDTEAVVGEFEELQEELALEEIEEELAVEPVEVAKTMGPLADAFEEIDDIETDPEAEGEEEAGA